MSITAEILKVLTKAGAMSVTKETGMTVADVRKQLGMPDSLEAMSGDRVVGEQDLVVDMSRLTFTKGSANNANLATMTDDELVTSIKLALGQANIAAGVYKAECSKDKKSNPMCDLANRLNLDEVLSAEDAIAIIESLPKRVAPSLYELVLRSSSDDKLAKFVASTAKNIATLAGRDGQYTQVKI